MKRSRINEIIREGDAFIRSFGFRLPPFAWRSPDWMRAHREAIEGIVEAGLGWDVTDYGQGRFDELGLLLFTLRNGRAADLKNGRGMLYAEKIMVSRRNQVAPMHCHAVKAEDIIVRGARDGAKLVLELYKSDIEGNIDTRREVTVPVDGTMRRLPAGGHLVLGEGESVTLLPGIWHAFWGEKGDVLVGEVSTVNDDLTDNIFLEEIERFPAIEEDEPPERLLVSDYGKWL